MLHNYLKISLRSLLRRKTYTVINVAGLSVAMACAAFIFNWVVDDLSYDTFYPKADRIYRVISEVTLEDDQWTQAVTSAPMAPALNDYFHEVENAVRLDVNDAIVEYQDKKFVEDYILLTDPSFFDIFDYKLIEGNTAQSLRDPYKIVLTESMAKKYFGNTSPIGRSLKLYLYDPNGNGADFEVTGVIQDAPKNSHFTFNFLVSFSTILTARPDVRDAWMDSGYYTYILLHPEAKANLLEAKIPQFANHHMGEQMAQNNLLYTFMLQPVTNIYHHSDAIYDFFTGNYDHVWIFSIIGFFVLALAGINYVNLATAFSFERVREVGVRKVLGAFKQQLIIQHLMETVLLVLISITLAGLQVEVFKPFFYELTGKSYLSFSWTSLAAQLSAFSTCIIIFAGFFPAKMIASLKPVNALKAQININTGQFSRWKLLVGFQFSVTLIILIGLFVVREQLSYVDKKDLGYDKENLLILRVNGSQEVKDGIAPFKNALKNQLNIHEVAISNSMIAGGLSNSNGTVKDDAGNPKTEMLFHLSIDYDYLLTYEIPLLAGRSFSHDIHSDSTEAFILNHQAVLAFGWSTPEEAIGKRMAFRGRKGQVIGVAKDFHFNSLHHNIGPVCMYLPSGNFSRISIRGIGDASSLAQVESIWNKHFPNSLFDHAFQDQVLISNYRSEQKFGQIFNTFSIISLIIAFLGLFGLVGFTVGKKTKEIGIRKVLGASVSQIITLVSQDFIKLIGLAALIAFPIAWWVMGLWLDDFPFRTAMKPWFFAAAVSSVFVLSIAVVFIRTFRTSMANPIDALKEE